MQVLASFIVKKRIYQSRLDWTKLWFMLVGPRLWTGPWMHRVLICLREHLNNSLGHSRNFSITCVNFDRHHINNSLLHGSPNVQVCMTNLGKVYTLTCLSKSFSFERRLWNRCHSTSCMCCHKVNYCFFLNVILFKCDSFCLQFTHFLLGNMPTQILTAQNIVNLKLYEYNHQSKSIARHQDESMISPRIDNMGLEIINI